MQYIGISGVNGGGKDIIAEALAEKGFFVVSATDMLADGLRKKGWPIDREHKSKLSAEWRRENGMGAVVDEALKLFEPVKDQYKGFAVGSLRHPGEANRIHELEGGLVVWVDADPKVAYKRVVGTAGRPNKGAEDNVTFEEFVAQQKREMHPIGDAATLNIADVKPLADVLLENNGNDLVAFKKIVQQKLIKS